MSFYFQYRLLFLFGTEVRGHLRCVDYQAVPLPLDVIFRWLFSDIQAIELQLPGNFFFPFEYHQRDLGVGRHWLLKGGFLITALSPKHSPQIGLSNFRVVISLSLSLSFLSLFFFK